MSSHFRRLVVESLTDCSPTVVMPHRVVRLVTNSVVSTNNVNSLRGLRFAVIRHEVVDAVIACSLCALSLYVDSIVYYSLLYERLPAALTIRSKYVHVCRPRLDLPVFIAGGSWWEDQSCVMEALETLRL